MFVVNQDPESESDIDHEDREWPADIEEDEVEAETEETDWAPQEDSAPSTEDYSSQSEEELDGIDLTNEVR